MNENEMTNSFQQDAENAEPAQWGVSIPKKDEGSIILEKRRIKSAVNNAGTTMLIQFALSLVVQLAGGMVLGAIYAYKIKSANPGLTPEEYMALYQSSLLGGPGMMIINLITFLIANTAAVFIMLPAAKKLIPGNIAGKGRLPVSDVCLAITATLGLQGLSAFIQNIATMMTGYTGVDQITSNLSSFSDNTVSNAVMVIYFVFVAAITEELVMRGVVMRFLSPVNKTFAVIATAILFGLMHGNFNQIFNGFLLGLIFGYAAMKGSSVRTSIACHIAANANAMIVEYIGYAFAERSENIITIYFGAELVIGIICLVLLLKRNGKIDEAKDGAGISGKIIVEDSEEKNYTWKMYFTSPAVWIITAIYVLTAVSSLTAVNSATAIDGGTLPETSVTETVSE